MLGDLFIILFWWFLLFGLGIVFSPLTLFLFRKFFDKGYVFSKIIAILLISYFVWLLGSLKILPFFTETAWLVVILFGVLNSFIIKQQSAGQKKDLKQVVKKNWKIFAFEEILFFACLLFWSFIRGFQPNIQGLEKFMDYGFVNSILRSRYFPPADMWLAGKTINYYYFGHLVTAVLTKLSGTDSAITYNLMIATLFAFCFTAAFSIGANLIYLNSKGEARNSKQFWSFGFRILNLFRISDFGFRILIAGLLSAILLTLGGNLHLFYWFITHGNFSGYWYPDATRFIIQKFGAADNTIHEFPAYSFVVADLHGHLLNLPFVLFFIGLLLALFTNFKKNHYSLLLSLCLAVFYMTNAWDFPIYFLILGVTVLWFNYLNYGKAAKIISQTTLFIIFISLFAIFFSFPFHLNFKSIAQGVRMVDFRSPPWMLLVLWGFPLIITVNFFFFLLKKQASDIDHFIPVLLSVSWFLIAIPEFIYVKDIYIHSHQRANTMFKLTYQSFVMFYLVSGYIIIKALTGFKKKFLKLTLVVGHLSLIIFILLYSSFAIRSYYGLKQYQGLNGLKYLETFYPDDYQAILWLRKNIANHPVIVEAVGESYTDFARVSANTGLPTILGWRVHEWLWRGSFDESARRTEEVKTIYQSPDLAKTKELLAKYQAKLVFIGNLERQQYSNLQEEKFDQLGSLIFSSGKTKVYQLKAF